MCICVQHPELRRVHVRTTQDLKLDAERPEYHRATVHWTRSLQTTRRLMFAGLVLQLHVSVLYYVSIFLMPDCQAYVK